MQRLSLHSIACVIAACHFVFCVCNRSTAGHSLQPFFSTAQPDELFSKVTKRSRDPVYFDFVTRPDIGAPRWDIHIYNKEALSPGYWFVAPYAHLEQTSGGKSWNGPHIYDSEGELIWSGAPLFSHFNTYDFRIVRVGDKDMLSLIDPHREHGSGVIIDSDYTIYKEVDLRGALRETNMHDFTVVDNGTNALTLLKFLGPSTVEQSKVVGFDGECRTQGDGFEELRVVDNEPIFTWDARKWIGLDECTFRPGPVEDECHHAWDILHLNSIDKFPDGDYLVSSRHMDAIYKVSHEDGHVVWRLGGKKSDFKLPDKARFSRQHHARVHSQNETHTQISLFDNAHGSGPAQAEKPTSPISRGLLITLRTDTKPVTAELTAHYDHPRGGVTNSRGSMTFMPNGNVFMGWTYASRQSEHSAGGTVLMEAVFKKGDAHTYRNYKNHWVGKPSIPPAVHSAAFHDERQGIAKTVIHVSWNGATEVASWNLFRSDANGDVTEPLGNTPRQGFETAMSWNGYVAFVVLEALDKDGNRLNNGRSEIVKTVPPEDTQSPDVAEELQWLQDPSDVGLNLGSRFWLGLPWYLQNPIVVFVAGLICCAVVCGAVTVCILSSKRTSAGFKSGSSWWKPRSTLYEPVSDHAQFKDRQWAGDEEDARQFELGDDDEPDESNEKVDIFRHAVNKDDDGS